jgi:biopolymer transport protein TolR
MGGTRQHRTRLVHAAPKKLDPVKSDINVTPLVDVCLVLLIIFMVVTPMMTPGKDVPLPKAKNPNTKDDRGEQPIVSVYKQGDRVMYQFGKEQLADRADASALDQLKKLTSESLGKLASVKGGSTIKSIYVKADANMTFGDVYPALMALHDGGSQGVQLATDLPKPGEGTK